MAGIEARYQGVQIDPTVYDRINAKNTEGEFTYEARLARARMEDNDLFEDLYQEIEDREDLTRQLGESYDRIATILNDIVNAPRSTTHGKSYTQAAQIIAGRSSQGIANWAKRAPTENPEEQ